ncbi:assimilatory nitrite reductase (NAD(P)H) small subunit [Arthrobacter crystallopoietes BAB-32]|uniref:Assimilatory nitrite reductase (NAD(P)H) small subunit n=1 Tax=Arthrobacter crystallopoietes BAB-32 TaxID=1246476 RepID=N1V7J5_9MICC|nr:nitrite reductase small subunit NirD [Arthrobacter crystallopoietes]EMY36087.1 assimilatory nitrite reductase (NAD(P)H) small subunit [Arthrobacter crystallopoietes BAB-32]
MTVLTADEIRLDGLALRWHPVCRVDELEVAWGEAALVQGEQVALFKVSQTEVYAAAHRDPATGSCVMARGILGSKGWRRTIASPLHKQVYDLATGECYTDPQLSLPVYPVRVEAGLVEVGMPVVAGGGAAA